MGIYLDHAATSPIRPEIKNLVAELYDTELGNPSSRHSYARSAKKVLDDAREEISAILRVNYANIIFTSGGTESDNLAIYGTIRLNLQETIKEKYSAIVISEIEHRAVLNSAYEIGKIFQIPVKKIPVDTNGVVLISALEGILGKSEGQLSKRQLISVMASNNEIGSVQPIKEIHTLVKSLNVNNVFHSDAVQGACWLDTVDIVQNTDMTSLSAHKLGGPVGIGVLVIKDKVKLMPQIIGGGQQRERRSGTNDVISAAAMAMALKLNKKKDLNYFHELKKKFLNEIKASIAGVSETIPNEFSVDGMCHITVDGINGEELLFLLDECGVAASAGSACSSGSIAPSHVLMAIGAPEFGKAFIRLSFGWSTTEEDLNRAVPILKSCIEKLRR